MQKSYNLCWLTDTHLNFVGWSEIDKLADKIVGSGAKGVVITGDIAEAQNLIMLLEFLSTGLQQYGIVTYFVCGNHDYYKGSVAGVRAFLRKEFKNNPNLIYLSDIGHVSLTDKIALAGHDGWYDGGWPGYGNFFTSKLDMNDYYLIEELSACKKDKNLMHGVMCRFATEAANHIRSTLPAAFVDHDTVYYATHVPPFAESARAPNGHISDPDWMPSFCSRIAGEAFLEVMKSMPENKQLIILCGHSHTYYEHMPARNIKCFTGNARYRYPSICKTFLL